MLPFPSCSNPPRAAGLFCTQAKHPVCPIIFPVTRLVWPFSPKRDKFSFAFFLQISRHRIRTSRHVLQLFLRALHYAPSRLNTFPVSRSTPLFVPAMPLQTSIYSLPCFSLQDSMPSSFCLAHSLLRLLPCHCKYFLTSLAPFSPYLSYIASAA